MKTAIDIIRIRNDIYRQVRPLHRDTIHDLMSKNIREYMDAWREVNIAIQTGVPVNGIVSIQVKRLVQRSCEHYE